MALFPGCAATLFYQDSAKAAVRALAGCGIETVYPRGLSCCGLPLDSLGGRRDSTRLARRNLEMLCRPGVSSIVTVCSSCRMALERARSGRELPAVTDIFSLLAGSGTQPPAAASREVTACAKPAAPSGKITITWHKPCHSSTAPGLSVADPREIIASVPGVEYVEPGLAGCCGGGGAFRLLHFDLALQIGLAQATRLAQSGADLVATDCPGCRMQLEDMLGRLGADMRVVHPVELHDWSKDAGSVTRTVDGRQVGRPYLR